MKFVDEYRDPLSARQLVEQIRKMASRRWVLMEVCGGQTHSLLRHGIDQELEGTVELIHGPGCPVCVTDVVAIDLAIRIASFPDTVLASFGDMLRVPGSSSSLLAARTAGARVEIVYSPLEAVKYAAQHPQIQVVFFAVGFETTAPATALAVLQAQQLNLTNFTVLVSHVRVQPAMEQLLAAADCRVQGFLAAGHVCSITGHQSYKQLAERYHVPVVITGFEPVDLLEGILECVTQLENGTADVVNRYSRAVTPEGNPSAGRIVNNVYQTCDRIWRGLGSIQNGGCRLRDEYSAFDAERRFASVIRPAFPEGLALARLNLLTDGSTVTQCRAGDVLSGQLKPCDCSSFGTACSPDSPLGSPMVSSEGACAAYFRYHGAVPKKHAT
jgi:hydrogenase expression/formation protein HypD